VFINKFALQRMLTARHSRARNKYEDIKIFKAFKFIMGTSYLVFLFRE
jgi:hypothetical protein